MRDVLTELDHLRARLVALEGVVKHVVTPLLVATGPALARELLEEVRRAPVSAPTERERMLLEEYLARLADDVEARVRAKIGTRR